MRQKHIHGQLQVVREAPIGKSCPPASVKVKRMRKMQTVSQGPSSSKWPLHFVPSHPNPHGPLPSRKAARLSTGSLYPSSSTGQSPEQKIS